MEGSNSEYWISADGWGLEESGKSTLVMNNILNGTETPDTSTA